MKARILGIAMIIALPLLALGTYTGVASAQTFKTADTVSVGSDETVDGAAWLSGSSVDVAGTVNGDVYCAGQTVTISGTVNGDVLCAGQAVTVSGTVNGDVRLAGQTVTIDGNVSGSASAAGQTVHLAGGGKVGRDASFAGQNVNVHGGIARDLALASSNAMIDATIGRNVNAEVVALTIARDASINGNVSYTGPQKATIQEGAQVNGKVTYTQEAPKQNADAAFLLAPVIFGLALLWALMLLVSAILLALLFPRVLTDATTPVVAAPLQALIATLVGLVAVIVMPMVLLLLMVTVLALPLAIVLLVAWILVVLLSGAVTAYYLGRVIWRGATNAVGVMAIGTAILIILMVIPFLNALVALFSLWFGTGAILMELQRRYVRPNYALASATENGATRPARTTRSRTAK